MTWNESWGTDDSHCYKHLLSLGGRVFRRTGPGSWPFAHKLRGKYSMQHMHETGAEISALQYYGECASPLKRARLSNFGP